MNKYPGHDPEIDDNFHPTRCTTKRFSADDRLREQGFSIHSRPARQGEPMWIRGGAVFLQSEALLRAEQPTPPTFTNFTCNH